MLWSRWFNYSGSCADEKNLFSKQEKNIFCIPSSLENKKGITPNRLIKEGAFLVTEVEDVIKQYPELKLKKIELNKKCNIKSKKEVVVNEECRDVYECLDNEKIIHINEISKRLNLSISEVSYKLMMLELDDIVVSLPGNNYKKKWKQICI